MGKRTKVQAPAPEQRVGRDACLVHIYPTGPGMGTRYPLTNVPVTLGRNADCDIVVNDDSVSRRHACIHPDQDGYSVADLESTNGTYLNDVRISVQKLADGDYLSVGNSIFRFLAFGNVETAYHEEIYRLTIIDALTNIHNKRSLLEFLENEMSRAKRHSRPLTLVLFDIDRFKSINDRLGHLAGDHALRELAGCIKKLIRREDFFARYGGEEFALVMPETGRDEAIQSAERLREAVAQNAFHYQDHRFQLTISLGLITTGGGDSDSAVDLIRQADANLLRAKAEGRNRVVAI